MMEMGRSRTFLSAAFVMVATLGLAAVASATGVADLMGPLLAAQDRGAFGSVDGRAYAEPQRGGGEPSPYPAVSIMLMPRSTAFDSELDGIKASYRDSLDALLEAEPKLRTARVAFERALIEAGGGQLLLGESSSATGEFRFPRVPEGAWTLLAWREIPHAKAPTALKGNDARRYKERPQVFGYTTVIFWRMPVEVKAGESMTVRLHDRNQWLTAAREDRRIPDPNQPVTLPGQPPTSPPPR
jgi:hypothetical protein